MLKKTSETIGPCTTCPKRSTCVQICEELEAFLPKADDFTPFQEIATSPLLIDSINESPEPEAARPSSWRWADIADSVRPLLHKAMKECLTARQKQIVELVLEGNRQFEIAKNLKVSRVTIFWILKRAKAAIQEWFGGKNIKWEKTTFENLVEKEGRVVFFSEDDLISIYPKNQKPKAEQIAFLEKETFARPKITDQQREISRISDVERRIFENTTKEKRVASKCVSQDFLFAFSTMKPMKETTSVYQRAFIAKPGSAPRSGGIVLEMRAQRKGRRL